MDQFDHPDRHLRSITRSKSQLECFPRNGFGLEIRQEGNERLLESFDACTSTQNKQLGSLSMNGSSSHCPHYPLLQALLSQKNLSLKGTYTIRDVALMFGVSVRTISDWCADEKLKSRNLPGRARFLSDDLEQFLHKSIKCADARESKPGITS
jgi:Helix-turn-helix domain